MNIIIVHFVLIALNLFASFYAIPGIYHSIIINYLLQLIYIKLRRYINSRLLISILFRTDHVQQTDQETILMQQKYAIGPAESFILEFLRGLRRHTHKYIYMYIILQSKRKVYVKYFTDKKFRIDFLFKSLRLTIVKLFPVAHS